MIGYQALSLYKIIDRTYRIFPGVYRWEHRVISRLDGSLMWAASGITFGKCRISRRERSSMRIQQGFAVW